MDSTSSTPSCHDFLLEDAIDSLYNESTEEEESILRNVIHFRIVSSLETSSSPSYESIESFGKTEASPRGFLIGTLIEPLPSSTLDTLTSLLCTYNTPSPEQEEEAQEEDLEAKLRDLELSMASFDKTSLQIGDSIEAMSLRTQSWLPAQVSEIHASKQRLKIHFKGWKPKFDEWIEISSDRLASKEYSKYLELKFKKEKRNLISYGDQSKLDAFLSSSFSSSSSRQFCRVAIEIDDWCIDYTYANPSLWIISVHNIWYRIAGACSSSFAGLPDPKYASFFQSMQEKYIACTILAGCLFDILPTNPKTSFHTVLQEAKIRSASSSSFYSSSRWLTSDFVLRHYEFILDQLKDLQTQSVSGQTILFSKTVFCTQLKAQGEVWHQQKVESDQELLEEEGVGNEVERAFKRRRGEEDRKWMENIPEDVNDTVLINTLMGHKSLYKKIKYPIEDKVFWRFQKFRRIPIPPLPLPSHSPQLQILPKDLQTSLISIWTILINTSSFISFYSPSSSSSLRYPDLLAFEQAVLKHDDPSIEAVMIDLISFILFERYQKNNPIEICTNTSISEDDPLYNSMEEANIFLDPFASIFSDNRSTTGDSSVRKRMEALRNYLSTVKLIIMHFKKVY